MLVGRVVGRQLEPVQEGHLGARLQYAVHLPEEGLQVLGICERLDMVQGIERRVVEGERIVIVALHKVQLGAQHLRGLGEVLRVSDLGIVNVEPHHFRPCVCRHMVRDAPTAAAHVQHPLARANVQLVGHALLLPQQLVGEDALLQVHDRRDVHLLDVAHSAQVVDDLVVVDDVGRIFGPCVLLLVEQLVGFQEVIHVLLRQGHEGVECLSGGARPVPEHLRALLEVVACRCHKGCQQHH
mmetsp:Transcript_63741/g.164094  ORF Transcript_63741/g.164094 Transcript_63741/m.164094 type:complete len:240 (-) Transcript_63741:111-830(-)